MILPAIRRSFVTRKCSTIPDVERQTSGKHRQRRRTSCETVFLRARPPLFPDHIIADATTYFSPSWTTMLTAKFDLYRRLPEALKIAHSRGINQRNRATYKVGGADLTVRVRQRGGGSRPPTSLVKRRMSWSLNMVVKDGWWYAHQPRSSPLTFCIRTAPVRATLKSL